MSLTYFLSFLYPQILAKIDSSINGLITVEKSFGQNRIVVGGFWQSGNYSQAIMETALKNLKLKKKPLYRILLLGLAGGSAVDVINRHYPCSQITGVDIDPVMVEIGKKYFQLNSAKNLKIVISNAYEFIKSSQKKQIYDIILVDLYKGCDYPLFVGAEDFLKQVKKLLTADGVYIFNGSYIMENREKTNELVRKIRGQFLSVELIHKKPNLIIRGYQQET